MHQSLKTNKSNTIITLCVLIFAVILLISLYTHKWVNSDILVKFALLSDSHLNHSTSGQEATYQAHFDKAIKQVNAAGVDFVLIAGDLTQSGKPDEFLQFKAEISKFRFPVWFVPGNHDIGNKFSNQDKGDHVTLARIETYKKQMGPTWFCTDCAGVHIVCINSSLPGSGFEPEKQMWAFLDKELTNSTVKPTILLMHYPLFLKEPDEPGNYWNVEPKQRARLLGLLKKSNVKIVLSGHLHRPVTNILNGILFVTTPPTSFGIPEGKQNVGWTLITIFKNGKINVTFKKID